MELWNYNECMGYETPISGSFNNICRRDLLYLPTIVHLLFFLINRRNRSTYIEAWDWCKLISSFKILFISWYMYHARKSIVPMLSTLQISWCSKYNGSPITWSTCTNEFEPVPTLKHALPVSLFFSFRF